MLVTREHISFCAFVGQQAAQLTFDIVGREVVGYQFGNQLFVGQDVNQREMANGEEERLQPAYPA